MEQDTKIGRAGHTPGPWIAGGGRLVRVFDAGRVDPVCGVHRRGVHTGGHDPSETEANASLIAAAPDQHASGIELDRLFLVIESAVRNADPAHLPAVVAALKANRAAVAKAEGRQP